MRTIPAYVASLSQPVKRVPMAIPAAFIRGLEAEEAPFLLFSVVCICGVILIAVEIRKRKRRDKENSDSSRDFYTRDSRTNFGTLNSNWKLTGMEALSISLVTFDKPLRKLTFADLLEATNGFHNDSRIGSGGVGDIYKVQLKDGSVVAIKKLIHVSEQGDREFMAEMETTGKIKHWNPAPLLGYCKVGEERLLVYEYMKYGGLEDVLHDRKKAEIRLNWAARRNIAVGATRGLAFLHHNHEAPPKWRDASPPSDDIFIYWGANRQHTGIFKLIEESKSLLRKGH